MTTHQIHFYCRYSTIVEVLVPPLTTLSCVITFSSYSTSNAGTINDSIHQRPIISRCNNILEALGSLTLCLFIRLILMRGCELANIPRSIRPSASSLPYLSMHSAANISMRHSVDSSGSYLSCSIILPLDQACLILQGIIVEILLRKRGRYQVEGWRIGVDLVLVIAICSNEESQCRVFSNGGVLWDG